MISAHDCCLAHSDSLLLIRSLSLSLFHSVPLSVKNRGRREKEKEWERDRKREWERKEEQKSQRFSFTLYSSKIRLHLLEMLVAMIFVWFSNHRGRAFGCVFLWQKCFRNFSLPCIRHTYCVGHSHFSLMFQPANKHTFARLHADEQRAWDSFVCKSEIDKWNSHVSHLI